MKRHTESISLSPSLNSLHTKREFPHTRTVNKRILYISIQAVINALIIGLIAKALVLLIDIITNLAFYGKFSSNPAGPAGNHLGLFVIAIPIIGAIIVGIIARFGSAAIRGHGIPEAMEKIILDESKIPPLITLLKPISSAISIGTGGPFGAEGPIIATGGAFGSFMGQIMYITPSERKIMLSAGACAGMAAIFGSPLSAVLLAIELLLFEFSPRSIIPVTLACVTGAGMHIALFGSNAVFAMPDIPAPTSQGLIIYVGIGLFMGIAAALVSKSVYAIEDLFEKLPFHWMWWPAIGAIAVGIIGYYAPYTMGVGYNNIQALLSGTLPLSLLLSLCVLKYISWAISLGSGTSGGTLAPLFTIGGALGALIGSLLLFWFPHIEISLTTVALVGMAAMFAGASRALLTSVVFALETTRQPNSLLPLLCTCIAAYFVSFFLMKGSIMTEKIRRRGVTTPESYHPDILEHAHVRDLTLPLEINETFPIVSENATLSACLQTMGKLNISTLMVADNGKAKGKIIMADIVKFYTYSKSGDQLYSTSRNVKRWLVRSRQIISSKK